MAIIKAVDGAHELTAEDRHERGVNHSSIHTDFMIGSRELAVSGVTKDGDEVPILRDGDWVLSVRRARRPPAASFAPRQSGRRDLNARPPAPKAGALPG